MISLPNLPLSFSNVIDFFILQTILYMIFLFIMVAGALYYYVSYLKRSYPYSYDYEKNEMNEMNEINEMNKKNEKNEKYKYEFRVNMVELNQML